MNKYLLEIGTEELPYKFVNTGLEQLKKAFEKLLKENQISFTDIKSFSTPRRLTLIIEGFEAKQPDTVKTVKGPILNIAYDENGNLSKAQYIDTIRDLDAAYKPKHQNYVFKKDGFVFIVVDGAKEIIPNAVGYYRKDTLDWLEKQLTKYKKSPVIIAQHYPIVPPKVSSSHDTYKKEEYLARLDKYNNVVAVISGHYHMNVEQMRNGVYHISSPSLIVPPNYYKIIEISTTKGFSPLIYTELRAISPTED